MGNRVNKTNGRDLKDWKEKLSVSSMQWKAIGDMDNGLASVFKFAQGKYGNIDSWKNRDEHSIVKYKDALIRHLFAILRGEDIDGESGLPHLAHLSWNVLTLLEFYIEDIKIDQKKKDNALFDRIIKDNGRSG